MRRVVRLSNRTAKWASSSPIFLLIAAGDRPRWRQAHQQRIEGEDRLTGFGATPAFAIDQRAPLLQADAGNILCKCVSLVTDEAVDTIKKMQDSVVLTGRNVLWSPVGHVLPTGRGVLEGTRA